MNSPTIEAYARLRGAFELAELEAALMNPPAPVLLVNTADLGMVINAFRDLDRPPMRAVIELCEAQFRQYAQHHLDKEPPDSEKAERNRRMADMCAAALKTSKGETTMDTETIDGLKKSATHYDQMGDAYHEAADRAREALANAGVPIGIADRITINTALIAAGFALRRALPYITGKGPGSRGDRTEVEQCLALLDRLAPVTDRR